MSETPIITKMEVIPVAGYDSMLMTLSGAHAPVFTRNIVILTDSMGHEGIGEIHGGDYALSFLKNLIPLVEGRQIGAYRHILQDVHALYDNTRLDLFGQFLGLPMAELLGEGKQRDEVEILGYLFYVSDKAKAEGAPLKYIDEYSSKDAWFRLRRETILTPERIVEEAAAVKEKYGVTNFKLKGGVLSGKEELEALKALRKAFPEARINIDPNGAWSLSEAIELAREMKGLVTYVEDPCGPEDGFSGREIMREFKNATNLPVATNMIATNWRQLYHTVIESACDIILADPHFWGFDGTIRMSQLLKPWGLTWGIHSNNHFDITLAAFAQVGASAVGNIAPLDTHWIWQDGQNLLLDTPEIRGGKIILPDAPGLGVHINRARLEEANRLYESLASHDRNDAEYMQYLIPNWVYDSKKPCLVR